MADIEEAPLGLQEPLATFPQRFDADRVEHEIEWLFPVNVGKVLRKVHISIVYRLVGAEAGNERCGGGGASSDNVCAVSFGYLRERRAW